MSDNENKVPLPDLENGGAATVPDMADMAQKAWSSLPMEALQFPGM